MKTKERIIKSKQGITLIALIITIIVLLILAGVALNALIGNNSIIENADNAVGKYNNSVKEEQNELDKINEQLNNYVSGTVEDQNPPKEIVWTSPTEIFNGNGKNTTDEGYDSTKLHIGDFVNYDAGTWRAEEITELTKEKIQKSRGEIWNEYQQ